MTVSFRCPSCHMAFRVEDSSLGKTVICPNPACNRKAVLPNTGGKQLGSSKPATRSRLQRPAKAAVPVAEKSTVASQEVKPHQPQPVSSTSMSKEVQLVVGIGSAAAILICFFLAYLLFRDNGPDKFSSIVATSEIRPAADSAVQQQLPVAASPDTLKPSGPTASDKIQSSVTNQAKTITNQSEASEKEMTHLTPLTIEEVAKMTEPSIAFIEGQTGTGTGFLIHEGIVATNRHVIEEELMEQLEIHFPSAPSGQQGPFTAELIYKDPDKDLAFLKVVTTLAPLKTPAQHSFRRGQEVIVIGNPGIGNQVLQNAVSRGVMSTEYTSDTDGQQYYQLGISINPGNSGGPVLDMSGNVLGVLALKARQQEGVAFCVPLPQLNEAWEKARKLSESEIAVIVSQHRLGVVVGNVSITGEAYEDGMLTYLGSMDAALKSGKTASSGLEQVRDKVSNELSRLNGLFIDGDISREASRVASDSNIPERIRGQFADLWTNYKELKSNVENPRGTYETYHTKFLQLSDKHDRLMHALNLYLGVKEQ